MSDPETPVEVKQAVPVEAAEPGHRVAGAAGHHQPVGDGAQQFVPCLREAQQSDAPAVGEHVDPIAGHHVQLLGQTCVEHGVAPRHVDLRPFVLTVGTKR